MKKKMKPKRARAVGVPRASGYRPEKKYVTQVGGGTVPSATTACPALEIGNTGGTQFATLTQIAQGTGHKTRDGDRIVLDSIAMRVRLYDDRALDPTTPATKFTSYVRWMVVLDKMNNAGGPGGNDTFGKIMQLDDVNDQAGNGTLPTSFGPLALRSLSNTSRYVVLYDKVHCLGKPETFPTATDPGYANAETQFGVYISDLSMPIYFKRDNTGGTAEQITNNNVFAIAIANVPSIKWSCVSRARFFDA